MSAPATRTAYGPENGWLRRAEASGTGRIRVAGVERDVTFAEPEPLSVTVSVGPVS